MSNDQVWSDALHSIENRYIAGKISKFEAEMEMRRLGLEWDQVDAHLEAANDPDGPSR